MMMPAPGFLRQIKTKRGQNLLQKEYDFLHASGNRRELRMFLIAAGRVYAEAAMQELARCCFAEALALARTDAQHLSAVHAIEGLAIAAHEMRRFDEAMSCCVALDPELQLLGATLGIAQNRLRIAALLRRFGSIRQALELSRQACDNVRSCSGGETLVAFPRMARAE